MDAEPDGEALEHPNSLLHLCLRRGFQIPDEEAAPDLQPDATAIHCEHPITSERLIVMECPIAVGPGKPLGEKRVIENGIDREVRAQSSLEVSLVKAVQTAHAARNPLHPERKDRQPVLDQVIDMRVANADEALI